MLLLALQTGSAQGLATRLELGLFSSPIAGHLSVVADWSLTARLEARYALGLTGSLDQGFWTLEGGSPVPCRYCQRLTSWPGSGSYPRGKKIAGPWAHICTSCTPGAQLSAAYIQSRPDYQMTGALGVLLGPQPPTLAFRLAVWVFQ